MRCLPVFLLLFGFAACAPKEQVFVPRSSAPKIEDSMVYTGDQQNIPLRRWLPEGKPKAVILALHGFNDYSNAFAMPGDYFAKQGIAVYAYDQRGFGRSLEWTVWPGEKNLTHDVADTARALRGEYPGIPLYILGESMGAAVAILTLARHRPPEVDGAVLVSPAVWGYDTMPFFYQGGLWLAAHTVPQMRISGRGLKRYASDNIEMLRALGQDPLVIKHTRIDAIYGLVRIMSEASREIPDVKTPMLILFGKNDQIVPPPAMEDLANRATAPHEVICYDEGYHMLMRDLEGEKVTADIAEWIATSSHALAKPGRGGQ